MAKEKQKRVDKRDKKANVSEAESKKPEATPAEPPFDFGGLPPRDLKKSLGCG